MSYNANTIRHYQGEFQTPKGKIAIVTGHFNEFIVESLFSGAVSTLQKQGVNESQIERFSVPGAFEIPFICQQLAKTQKYSGIIALGAVIRGATPHFDYVAGPCANGIAKIQLEYNLPISFGVLTTETIEQAIERAGTKAGNKGSESAMVLIEMLSLMEKIHG